MNAEQLQAVMDLLAGGAGELVGYVLLTGWFLLFGGIAMLCATVLGVAGWRLGMHLQKETVEWGHWGAAALIAAFPLLIGTILASEGLVRLIAPLGSAIKMLIE